VFDHVMFRTVDQAASERFYRTVLGAIGIEPNHESGALVEWDDFSIAIAREQRPATRHAHVGFVAPSRDHVDAFWRAGIDAGYADDGAPGVRAQYSPEYYGGFLLDPDGNSVEAVHHDDTRRGGHIDHLWIRVRDLDATAAFYSAIARHAGLRQGLTWDRGRQFRGGWSTFSLIDDGRPLTENLHIAFPAPDRQTVRDFHAAAIAAGYQSNGEPGERPQYHPGYYAAFVIDPDGANIESVYHGRP
jgi:catechol 2,3-dioxygenase-like lactoylglutathione lyase family enzyme